MYGKFLGISITILVVAMLASPVLAIGPQNAQESSNTNFVFTGFSVQLHVSNGFINEWITDDPSHVQIKSADNFQIKNAYTPSSASEIMYNKWNYLSSIVFNEFLISVGFEPGQANYIAFVLNPNGVYYKEVYPGN